MWYLLLVVFLLVLIVYLFLSYLKDRKRLKKRTVETLGNDLWNEIGRERELEIEKGKMFRKVLEKAKKKDLRDKD